MFSNVSFSGRLFLAGDIKHQAKKSEVKILRKYADEQDCDVVVLKRSYYSDGTGSYLTKIVHVDKDTGSNLVSDKKFDFKKGVKI